MFDGVEVFNVRSDDQGVAALVSHDDRLVLRQIFALTEFRLALPQLLDFVGQVRRTGILAGDDPNFVHPLRRRGIELLGQFDQVLVLVLGRQDDQTIAAVIGNNQGPLFVDGGHARFAGLQRLHRLLIQLGQDVGQTLRVGVFQVEYFRFWEEQRPFHVELIDDRVGQRQLLGPA